MYFREFQKLEIGKCFQMTSTSLVTEYKSQDLKKTIVLMKSHRTAVTTIVKGTFGFNAGL